MSASRILQFPHPTGSTQAAPAYAMTPILPFPVQHSCPTCGRACSPEDLSECLTCEQKYCSHKSCSWLCACDRFALEMAQRAGLL
jgi:hypothetical protein